MQWILSATSILMLWLMGNKNKYAPLVGVSCQALWIIYVVSSQQWGLLIGVIGFLIVHVRNSWLWLRSNK